MFSRHKIFIFLTIFACAGNFGSEVFSQPNGIDFTQNSRGLYDYVIVTFDTMNTTYNI